MSSRFAILACLAMIVVGWIPHAAAQTKEAPLYAVVFGFTVVDNSRVENFRVEKIVDPFALEPTEVRMDLPQGFIDVAKKKVEGLTFKPQTSAVKRVDTTAIFLHSPGEASPAEGPVSWRALDGVMGKLIPVKWAGTPGQVNLFSKNLGTFAFSFSVYWISQKPEKVEERKMLIEQEIKRCATNLGGAEILSRKDTALGNQSIAEVTLKPPKNKNASIRFRVICSPKQMLAVTAAVPDDLDKATQEALDKVFEESHFR